MLPRYHLSSADSRRDSAGPDHARPGRQGRRGKGQRRSERCRALWQGLTRPNTPGIGRSSRANQTPPGQGGFQPPTPNLCRPRRVIFPFTAWHRVTQSVRDCKGYTLPRRGESATAGHQAPRGQQGKDRHNRTREQEARKGRRRRGGLATRRSEAEPPEAPLIWRGLREQRARNSAGTYDCGRPAGSFRVRGAKRNSSEAGPGAPGHEGRRKVGTEGRPAGAQRQRALTHERKTRPPCVRGHRGNGRRKPGGGTGARHAEEQGGRSA